MKNVLLSLFALSFCNIASAYTLEERAELASLNVKAEATYAASLLHRGVPLSNQRKCFIAGNIFSALSNGEFLQVDVDSLLTRFQLKAQDLVNFADELTYCGGIKLNEYAIINNSDLQERIDIIIDNSMIDTSVALRKYKAYSGTPTAEELCYAKGLLATTLTFAGSFEVDLKDIYKKFAVLEKDVLAFVDDEATCK